MKNTLATAFKASMESLELAEGQASEITDVIAGQSELEVADQAAAYETEQIADAMDQTTADIASLESIIAALQDHVEIGLESRAARFLHAAHAPLARRYNASPAMAMPSMESFGGSRAASRMATTISMESVGETLQKAWEWLKEMIAKMWEVAQDLYQRFRQVIGAQRRHAISLLERIKSEHGHIGPVVPPMTAAVTKVVQHTGDFDPKKWADRFRNQFSLGGDFTKRAMSALDNYARQIHANMKQDKTDGKIPRFTFPPVSGLNFFTRGSGIDGKTDVYPSGHRLIYSAKEVSSRYDPTIDAAGAVGEVTIEEVEPTYEAKVPRAYDVEAGLRAIIEFYDHQENYLVEGEKVIGKTTEALNDYQVNMKIDERTDSPHDYVDKSTAKSRAENSIRLIGWYFRQNKNFFEKLNTVANRSMVLLLKGCESTVVAHRKVAEETAAA